MRRAAGIIVLVASCTHGVVTTPLLAGAWVTPAVALAQQDDTDRIVFVLHDQSPAAGVLQAFDSVQGQLGELELDLAAVHLAQLEQVSGQARQAAQVAEQQLPTHALRPHVG